ncbi:MAG: heme exporter protein CcmD [Legionellales bacterium]|nr:heme exporter protein CcmD [Legionellales bacterium]|tara:strand:+ start:23057 stop:23203 length:147 start_codon:yes stop_codon:yes gene_type:complete
MTEWLHLSMGGYGGYVWPAYSVTAVVLAANVVFAYKRFSVSKPKEHGQ